MQVQARLINYNKKRNKAQVVITKGEGAQKRSFTRHVMVDFGRHAGIGYNCDESLAINKAATAALTKAEGSLVMAGKVQELVEVKLARATNALDKKLLTAALEMAEFKRGEASENFANALRNKASAEEKHPVNVTYFW